MSKPRTTSELEAYYNEFQATLTTYINNKLDYMQQEITMLHTRIDNLEGSLTREPSHP